MNFFRFVDDRMENFFKKQNDEHEMLTQNNAHDWI